MGIQFVEVVIFNYYYCLLFSLEQKEAPSKELSISIQFVYIFNYYYCLLFSLEQKEAPSKELSTRIQLGGVYITIFLYCSFIVLAICCFVVGIDKAFD